MHRTTMAVLVVALIVFLESSSRTVCRQTGGNRPECLRSRFIRQSHPQRVGCAHA